MIKSLWNVNKKHWPYDDEINDDDDEDDDEDDEEDEMFLPFAAENLLWFQKIQKKIVRYESKSSQLKTKEQTMFIKICVTFYLVIISLWLISWWQTICKRDTNQASNVMGSSIELDWCA